jgi:hypothetical protein
MYNKYSRLTETYRQHAPLRIMCGSRTGGWSLPGVMSDWQRCVDWFLAKYCRCRLWLDWCWCRWRTSTKRRRRWGLQVWRRQVGLVRGTRWPAGSSAGRMVARTAGRSRGRFLGWASKPRSSRDYVGAESTPSSWGLQWFTRKPLGYSVEPQNRGRRLDEEVRPPRPGGLTAQGGGLTAQVAATEKLRSGGHASGSQGLCRG